MTERHIAERETGLYTFSAEHKRGVFYQIR